MTRAGARGGRTGADRPAIAACAEKIAEVYQYNCVGGKGHAVFDDWNVNTLHVEGALRYAPVGDGSDEAADAALRLMLPMTQGERRACLRKAEKLSWSR